MKKAKSRKRTAAPKSRKAPKNVDEYFAALPEPARDAFARIRTTIRSVVPAQATETISYGIPAFKDKKVLVWFAAFADHCSLFPTSTVIEAFADDLKDFSTSKGTVHFPLDKALPVALIKKLVKAAVARQNR